MPFPATNPALERALAARDYSEPTSVQLAVLEPDAAGRDLLVSAQTGSGKTVAFGLAFAKTLLGDEEKFARAAAPLALIVAPTRELAMQVQRETAWLYAETGARVASCVGGMDVRSEKTALAAGTHIIVGTPGRLRDHIERGRLDTSCLRAVVLDEADEMLDLGFREDLQFILDATPAERQTLLFSATMPREIAALAKQYQRDALRIETASRNEPHGDIEYRAIRTAPNDIEHAVVNVLRFYEMRAALVFCSTREAVRRMHASLVERGFAAVALSGELSQAERTQALQSLRDGRSRVLVATDVAARGLDLPDLALVIHADLPNDRETLLHRSGRTGRAGRKGICVLIVSHTRRRRAEQLIGAAGVKVAWAPPPTAEEIRARDQQRLIEHPIFVEPSTEEDLALGRALLSGRSADDVAMALVRFHRTQLPAPEDILDQGAAARYQPDKRDGNDWKRGKAGDRDQDRSKRREGADFQRPAGKPAGRERTTDRPAARERTDSDHMVWFRLNIGREQNADPRWLLPLICRAGHVTKSEIGAIRIFDKDSRFQIDRDHADRFAAAVKADTKKEAHIARIGDASDSGEATPAEPPHAKVAASPARDAIRPFPDKGSREARSFTPNKYKSKRPPADAKPGEHKPRDFKPRDTASADHKPADHKPRGDKQFGGHKPPHPAVGGARAPFKPPFKKKKHRQATGA